jgi:hypothetical protein
LIVSKILQPIQTSDKTKQNKIMSVLSLDEYRRIQKKWDSGHFNKEDLQKVFDSDTSALIQTTISGGMKEDHGRHVGLSKRKDLRCIFWGQKENNLSYLLNTDNISNQMKDWKRGRKENQLTLLRANNRDWEYKGRKFYSFTLQPASDDGNFGADGTQLLFGWFCDGLTYYWTSKHNRDAIFDYIMGK